MARERSSSFVGTRTIASASRLPCTKRSQLQTQRLGIEPIGLHAPILLVRLLRANHVTVDPERAELPLQKKTKPACFINRVHFGVALLLEPGRPVQERFFCQTVRRLGIAPAYLLDHHVKILVHVIPSLIAVPPLNWQRVPSSEDNSVDNLSMYCIIAGEPNNLPALLHVI
jgi:hypothetical protein